MRSRWRRHDRQRRSWRWFRLIPSGWRWSGRRPSRSAGSAMCSDGWRRRRGPHLRARRTPRWRRWWGAELKYQPGSVLRIAESDRPAVMDENRGHSHAVDVDAGFAAIDGYPLPAVVMHHHVGGRGGHAHAVDADIRSAIAADGHVPADGKGVSIGSKPDDQRGSERFRRHSHHLPRPSSWVSWVE
jgi:uncharacterized protein YbdZ (MbtH family)